MPSYTVKTGRWTDWSKGSILGDQVTLLNTDANVLIALIAVLNTFVGAIIWKAVAYGLHQGLVSRSPRDGLHHQHQILLRTSESAISFALRIPSLAWSWRKHIGPKSLLLRVSALEIPAVVIFVGFTALSIILSKIASVGGVLLVPTHCGGWNFTSLAAVNMGELVNVYGAVFNDINRGVAISYAYALNCYNIPRTSTKNSSYDFEAPTGDNCNFFVEPRLNWTTLFPEECPFQDGLCNVPNSRVIQFDTGYIDSHYDLGINAASKNRVELRQTMTCSPVRTDDFVVDNIEAQSVPEAARSRQFFFGNDTSDPTFTYSYYSNQSRDSPYLLSVASDRVFNPVSTEPYVFRDSLLKQNYAGGSFTLYFLANQASYVHSPADDPWFNATTAVSAFLPPLIGVPVYGSQSPGSVVGCTTTFEMCNAAVSPRKCSSGDNFHYNVSALDFDIDYSSIGLNDIQQDTAAALTRVVYLGGAAQIATSMGPKALSANEYQIRYPSLDHFSFAIPSNQWEVEMARLFAAAMAMLQRGLWITITAADADPQVMPYIQQSDQRPSLTQLCNSQKIINTAYTSFSVLSLSLIFALNALVILLGFIIGFIVPKIQVRFQNGHYRRRAWAANSPVQLQRALYQLLGYGDWEGSAFDTPLTKQPETFSGFLDVEKVTECVLGSEGSLVQGYKKSSMSSDSGVSL